MVLPYGRASVGRAAPVTSLGVALAVNPGRTLVGDGDGRRVSLLRTGLVRSSGWRKLLVGLGSAVVCAVRGRL
jgi:hypothetical protein